MRRVFDVPLRDVDCAFKLMRRDLVQALPLAAEGAMVSTELVTRAHEAGARIAELGVGHRPRMAGRSSGASPRVVLRAFRELRACARSCARARRPARPPTCRRPRGGRRAARPVAAARRVVRRAWRGLGPEAAVLALAAVLRLAALGRVPTNPYYDAAVRSMGTSWAAFLSGAFEPGRRVAIDKPPVDLWLQVASTRLLGFDGVALLLPEALGGVALVAALMWLLRTLLGRGGRARRRAGAGRGCPRR